jgi:signal transduction histidine kinase
VTSLATKQSDGLKMELTHLAAENQALRHQLRKAQSLATVGTITAMIVHEFNNILTPIINYAQLAAGGDEEMVRKAITKASEGGQRAVDICQALLGLLREDAVDPIKAPVAEMVEQSLLATGRNLAKDGIDLHLDVPPDLTITTRPSEIKQVLVNLLLNARSAILSKGRHGKIRISATGQDGRITLSLADSGTGISPENLDMIFEPFFTTKTGQDGQELGNGLGLALCKEIITSMGGEIRVETRLGEGATFFLDLPM